MIITITQERCSITDLYYVTVETNGRRYETYYTTKPTTEDVKEDFFENRPSFNHINKEETK
jgi:hypothetical protein